MPTHDRARDLADKDDLWAEIRPFLVDASREACTHVTHFALDLEDHLAPLYETDLKEKFRKGEAEHGRDWLGMTREQLYRELHDEIKDLVLYQAMILARFVDNLEDEFEAVIV